VSGQRRPGLAISDGLLVQPLAAQSGIAVDEDHVIPSLGDVDIIISHDAPRPALRRSRRAIVMAAICRHAEGVARFWRQRATTGDLLQPFPRQRDFHRPSAVLLLGAVDRPIDEHGMLATGQLIVQVGVPTNIFAVPRNIIENVGSLEESSSSEKRCSRTSGSTHVQRI